MKKKFLDLIKQKYASVGLSDKVAETIFDLIGSAITDETQLETAVNGVEPMVKAFQSQEDSRVNTAVAKVKAEKTETPTPAKPEEKKEDPAAPVAETATEKMLKLLSENVVALTQKFEGLETKKVVDTRRNQFLETVKDFPETFKKPIERNIDRMLETFKTDEEYSTWLNEIKADGDAFQTDLTKQGITNFPPPGRGTGPVGTVKATEKELADIAAIL